MNTQSLYEILCIFLDWHPAQIKIFAELICAVTRVKTIKQQILCNFIFYLWVR